MSPLKTRILGRATASLVGVACFPIFLIAATALERSIGALTQATLFLALGASILGAFLVHRWAYDELCARWSDEKRPPRSARWIPWRIRDLN